MGFSVTNQQNLLYIFTFRKQRNAIFLIKSGKHFKMGLEPDFLINKPINFREKTDKDSVNFFDEKMVKINEIFKIKKRLVFIQTSYKYYANVHKQNVSN